MKCKRSIMGLAALLILVFHFYIPIGRSTFETFLRQSAYCGVDLFFFVSAYSLGTRNTIKFGAFYLNRLYYIYLSFAIMTLIATIYKHWEFERFIKILIGVELYNKGGGSFLWFVIAIMIFYLLAPLLVKLKNKYGILSLLLFLGGWLLVAVLFQYVLKNKAAFIVINRLPIFLLGLYYEDYRRLNLKKAGLLIAGIAFVIGCLLVNRWGIYIRLAKPFWDMFYVLAIPMVLGIVGIFDSISEMTKLRNIPLSLLGKITLELYGLQMIFGYDIEMKIYKQTRNGLISFLVTVIILIAMATVFSVAMKYFRKILSKIKECFKNEKVNG